MLRVYLSDHGHSARGWVAVTSFTRLHNRISKYRSFNLKTSQANSESAPVYTNLCGRLSSNQGPTGNKTS